MRSPEYAAVAQSAKSCSRALGGRGAVLRPGDSGAPVFTGDGVALGIFFARNSRNAQVGYFSQIRNVEDELNVRVLRG